MSKINKICVIGAGMMGASIAAQAANGGCEVILLDLNLELAKQNFVKLQIQRPPALSLPEYSSRIEVGSLESDLAKISECDLVIEAIIEKLEVKQQLYQDITPHLKPSAILASNTSTLQLSKLQAKMPSSVQQSFCIVHFFNPPRYMKLVELVASNLLPEALESLEHFLHDVLGKTIIKVNDQPGFIVNRLCCFLLEITARKAFKSKLSCHQLDQIFIKYFGFPKTGIFGLYDLIGHDVMNLIGQSFWASLASGDRYNILCQDDPTLAKLRASGRLGRKVGKGFYQMLKQDGEKLLQELDLQNLEYRKVLADNLPTTLEEFFALNNEYSVVIRDVLVEFFSYCHSIMPAVTDKASDIDQALRLGNNIKMGPFELLSKLPGGSNWLQDNISKLPGLKLPSNYGKIELPSKAQTKQNLIKEVKGAYYYIEGNSHVFVLDGKMNCLTEEVFELLDYAGSKAAEGGSKLVICSAKPYFSAGADLNYFYDLATKKEFNKLDQHLAKVQTILRRVKYSPSLVISAASGFALGGGCEILLHSNYIVGHQNLASGLVELGVGLVPAYGGTTEMLERAQDEAIGMQALLNILQQNKSQSADQFIRDYGASGMVMMHNDDLASSALSLNHKHSKRSQGKDIKLSPNLLQKLQSFSPTGAMQEYVLEWLISIYQQGQITIEASLAQEREKFTSLCQNELSLQLMNKIIHRT